LIGGRTCKGCGKIGNQLLESHPVPNSQLSPLAVGDVAPLFLLLHEDGNAQIGIDHRYKKLTEQDRLFAADALENRKGDHQQWKRHQYHGLERP
jgi:hypothetical protein